MMENSKETKKKSVEICCEGLFVWLLKNCGFNNVISAPFPMISPCKSVTIENADFVAEIKKCPVCSKPVKVCSPPDKG